MNDDLSDLSPKRLDDEFERLSTLRDECEASMKAIRAEQGRRRDAEIAELRAEIAKKGGDA